jgi:uncharacterized membrane protein
MGLLAVVAVVSLLLAVIDYIAWVATVDYSFWGTVTGILDWVFVLLVVACVVVLIRRAVRSMAHARRADGRK